MRDLSVYVGYVIGLATMWLRNGSLEKESEMNIDIAKILVSPDRDLEIRKLISEYFPEILPKPWKHDFYNTHDKGHPIVKCYNCDCEFRGEGYEQSCPIPDPIALDWNLAMKMRDECQHMKFIVAMNKVFIRVAEIGKHPCGLNYGAWITTDAQPHHYILAAIMAGEYTE